MEVTRPVAVDDGTQPPGDRSGWSALPRRRSRRGIRLLAIRTPISRPARLLLISASILIPVLFWLVVSFARLANPAFAESFGVTETFLPPPWAVWSAGVEMAQSGQLFTDAWASIQRVLLGFGLAVLVSVPLGIIMGSLAAGRALFEPLIGLLRYLPASAFIPLLLIWLGIGEGSKVALLFIGTVFFNTLMTADAVRLVPGDLIEVSYTLGARRTEVLRKVIVPHALPGMIDAIRVNAAAAWNFVVVAELLAAEEGLGYRIIRSQRFLQTDRIFAILVVIGLIGLTIDIALRLLRDRIGKWCP